MPDNENPELEAAEQLVRKLPLFDWGYQEITRTTFWTIVIFAALWWSGWLNPFWALLVFPFALYVQFGRKGGAPPSSSPESAA